jgi:carboxyl-terminal processing protease
MVVALVSACARQQGTIGAVIGQQQDGRLFLRDVPSGLAAERAGLREGDEILHIDGMDVRAMSPAQVHQALSGEVGEPIKLTVVRGEKVLRVTLQRTPARRHRPAQGARESK